jgi:heme oxygenase
LLHYSLLIFTIYGMLLMLAEADSTLYPARDDGRSSGQDLRSRLKKATDKAHRDLDVQFATLDLCRLEGYRRFLEASAAALLPLERALEFAGVADVFVDWHQRTRRAALIADLASIGADARPLKVSYPMNRNAVIGIMYVLEGSRLGAKYLLRMIARSADPLIPAATAYLSHGAELHLWQSFLEVLKRETVAVHDEVEIVNGARMAFSMFAQAAARA